MKLQQGFTLIELMIVISIIGILSAIAIPAYQDYITRTQLAEALDLVSNVKGGVVETYTTIGICPNNSNSIQFGMAKADEITGNYISSIMASGTAPNCYIEVSFKSSNISRPLQNKKLQFDLKASEGSYRWDCYSNDIQIQYLPNGCR